MNGKFTVRKAEEKDIVLLQNMNKLVLCKSMEESIFPTFVNK